MTLRFIFSQEKPSIIKYKVIDHTCLWHRSRSTRTLASPSEGPTSHQAKRLRRVRGSFSWPSSRPTKCLCRKPRLRSCGYSKRNSSGCRPRECTTRRSPEGDTRSYSDMVERHIHQNTLPRARKTTKKFQVTITVISSVSTLTLTLPSEGLASLLAWVSGSFSWQ